MLQLPSTSFDIPVWTEAKVHLDHHYTVDGNFYSVPTNYIGKTLQIRIGIKTINAYENHQLVKSHIRHYGKGHWVTDENDYPKYIAKYLAEDSTYCLDEAKKIGESTFELMKVILIGSGAVATLVCLGLAGVLTTYSPVVPWATFCGLEDFDGIPI